MSAGPLDDLMDTLDALAALLRAVRRLLEWLWSWLCGVFCHRRDTIAGVDFEIH